MADGKKDEAGKGAGSVPLRGVHSNLGAGGVTDEPKPPKDLGLSVPLTEAVLASFERLARGEPTEDLVKALVAEARRLRQLIIDAEPYLPDNEQTRTMDLPARLKAEVDRG